jgi:hypothetical protein
MLIELPEGALISRLLRMRSVTRPLMAWVVAVGSGVAIASPGSAATFALSQGLVQFSNFSANPLTNTTTADKNDFVIAKSSQAEVVSVSNALASFPTTGSTINQTSSLVEGTSGDYVGIGTSTAGLLGTFQIQDVFSFDFFSFLRLQVGVDEPNSEHAEAVGSISIQIEDITDLNAPIILDELSFGGSVASSSSVEFSGGATDGFQLAPNTAPDCTADTSCIQSTSDKTSSLIFAQVIGSYERRFDRATTLRLTELKNNRATASAPEPGVLLALMLGAAVIGSLRFSRKGQQLT